MGPVQTGGMLTGPNAISLPCKLKGERKKEIRQSPSADLLISRSIMSYRHVSLPKMEENN